MLKQTLIVRGTPEIMSLRTRPSTAFHVVSGVSRVIESVMALNQWFKFYGGEYLSDPKIASLTPQERSCWVTLLCLASISSTPGTVEYLTVDALLEKSGIRWNPYETDEWDRAQGVLEKFVRMKMIEKGEEGVISITNWKKRQETALTNAERQRKYRERNEKVTGRVTNVTLDKIREDKNTSVAIAPHLEVEEVPEDNARTKKPPKYPNARTVFSWFPRPEPSWALNTTELKHAELLFKRGEAEVKKRMRFLEAHAGEDFLPVITKPSDLERKWNDLTAYAKRNS